MYNLTSRLHLTAEHALQEKISEMRSTWQEPSAAWDEQASNAWDDPNPVSTTSVQIETVNSVTDSAPQSADGAGGVIKCIAFYPYTVNIQHNFGPDLWAYSTLLSFFSRHKTQMNYP